jgi:lysophospholipase L1-like esterase
MSTSVWVGEMARLMKTNGISGTIINGGVGGYSSSQELIKVVRDVVELEPDVVVTYDGINDVGGRYSSPPYRMVHPYQNRILNFLVSRDQETMILPNVIRMLRDFQISVGGNVGTVKSIILGLPSKRTHAEFWVRNLDMIHAICNQFGIKYVGILQPASGVYEIAKEHKNPKDVYIKELKSFYAEATMAVGTRSYLEDFSKVLLGEKGTYKPDGRHLTTKGNAIIARSILDILIKKGHI